MPAATDHRSPTRKEAQGARSRERILNAASTLMSERGYAGTSISLIAQHSGLPPSSIYWHFESKAGLLAAVMAQGTDHWFNRIPRWDDLDSSPPVRFRELTERVGESLAEDSEFMRLYFMLALEQQGREAQVLDVVRRVREEATTRLCEMISGRFAELGERGAFATARELSRFTLACIDGAFLAQQLDSEPLDMARLMQRLRVAIEALVADDLRPEVSGAA